MSWFTQFLRSCLEQNFKILEHKTNKDFFNLQNPTIKDRSSEFNKYHYVTRHMSINL